MAKKPVKKVARKPAKKHPAKRIPKDVQQEVNDALDRIAKGRIATLSPEAELEFERKLHERQRQITEGTIAWGEKNAGIIEPPPAPTYPPPDTASATPIVNITAEVEANEREHATVRAGLILAIGAFIIAVGLLWAILA